MAKNERSGNNGGTHDLPLSDEEQRNLTGAKHLRPNPKDRIPAPHKWMRPLLRYRGSRVKIGIAFLSMLTAVVAAYFSWLGVQSNRIADRPYIQISVTAQSLVVGQQTIGRLDVTNVGRTPALDLYVSLGGGMAFRREPVEHILTVHALDVPHQHGPFQLAPGEHRMLPFAFGGASRPFTKTEYDLVTKRVMPLYMIAVFQYRDGFGNVYDSDRFCFEYTGDDPRTAFQPCDDQRHEHK